MDDSKMEMNFARRDRLVRKLKQQHNRHKFVTRCNMAVIAADMVVLVLLNHYDKIHTDEPMIWLCILVMVAAATGQVFNEIKSDRVKEQINRIQNHR